MFGSILRTRLIFLTGHATFGWSGSEWPPEQLKGKAMGTVDILSLIKLGNLSDDQKAHLKNKLTERKRDLEAAMKRVDQGLKLLAKKSKAKKSAKRRTR